MILVAGATGVLGGEICRRLVSMGKSVRGMVRTTSDPAKVDNLKSMGVSLVEADLKDRASLDAACQGVETVISTVSTTLSRQAGDSIETVDQQGQLALIDSAKAAGVSHFIYMSFSVTAEGDAPSPLSTAKRTVENHLMQSGMAYTILRPTNFMEIWLSPALGFDYINGNIQVYGDGHGKTHWISLGDVAEAAVRSVDTEGMRGATFEMGGPEGLGYLDVIRIFEEVSGRTFQAQHVPEEALMAQVAGATDSLQKSFAQLMLATAKGGEIDNTPLLDVIPMTLVSVREYALRAMPTAAV
jgi:uncharacterized protein YbjT (DUF2867 family)